MQRLLNCRAVVNQRVLDFRAIQRLIESERFTKAFNDLEDTKQIELNEEA